MAAHAQFCSRFGVRVNLSTGSSHGSYSEFWVSVSRSQWLVNGNFGSDFGFGFRDSVGFEPNPVDSVNTRVNSGQQRSNRPTTVNIKDPEYYSCTLANSSSWNNLMETHVVSFAQEYEDFSRKIRKEFGPNFYTTVYAPIDTSCNSEIFLYTNYSG
ncbi:hypothetical protein Hdeb2414_s0004g00132311 [Helianthus debilis subsp. tardiflorus]